MGLSPIQVQVSSREQKRRDKNVRPHAKERTKTGTHLVPSEEQDSNDLEGEPKRGEEHAQVAAPLEELNGVTRG